MTPTEHEGTVAVDAAARRLYDRVPGPCGHGEDCAGDGPDCWEDKAAKPVFDDLPLLARNELREHVLPVVWAALQALPDRRRTAWAEGLKAGEDYMASWARDPAGGALTGRGRPRPTNPYEDES